MGRMSKSVYVRVVHDLGLLRCVLRCAIERQLWFPTGINKVYCYCYPSVPRNFHAKFRFNRLSGSNTNSERRPRPRDKPTHRPSSTHRPRDRPRSTHRPNPCKYRVVLLTVASVYVSDVIMRCEWVRCATESKEKERWLNEWVDFNAREMTVWVLTLRRWLGLNSMIFWFNF